MECPRCRLVNPPQASRCDCGYDFATGRVEVSHLTRGGGGLPLASLGDRFLAQLVDGFVSNAPLVAVIVVGQVLPLPDAISALALCVGMAYVLLGDSLRGGQSLGKRLLGIGVVDARTGAPCTIGQALLRNALRILGLIDWLFIFDSRRQRLGDRAASTLVVRRPARR